MIFYIGNSWVHYIFPLSSSSGELPQPLSLEDAWWWVSLCSTIELLSLIWLREWALSRIHINVEHASHPNLAVLLTYVDIKKFGAGSVPYAGVTLPLPPIHTSWRARDGLQRYIIFELYTIPKSFQPIRFQHCWQLMGYTYHGKDMPRLLTWGGYPIPFQSFKRWMSSSSWWLGEPRQDVWVCLFFCSQFIKKRCGTTR